MLTETWRNDDGPSRRSVRPQGTGSAFGPERVHIVQNRGLRNATSVHAYSPPLLPLGDARVEEPAFAELPATEPLA